MSEREYSGHSSRSRGAIQKARKAGRLVVYGDGSINAAASDARRADITDPDQQRRSTGGDLIVTPSSVVRFCWVPKATIRAGGLVATSTLYKTGEKPPSTRSLMPVM